MSFFSNGSNPASHTALITLSSLVNFLTERPSTSFQPCHSLPPMACFKAYSLMSFAHAVSSSTWERITSISMSSSRSGSLKSCFASRRLASALARQACLALQNPHHSPAQNLPSPAKAKLAIGFSVFSAHWRSSSREISQVLMFSRRGW